MYQVTAGYAGWPRRQEAQKRVLKVPGGQRTDPPGSHVGQIRSGVAKWKGLAFEIKMVIMQNLFGSQVIQVAIKTVQHRGEIWRHVALVFIFLFFYSTPHPSVKPPTSNKYFSTPVPTPVISEPSGSPALLSFTFHIFYLYLHPAPLGVPTTCLPSCVCIGCVWLLV